MLYKREYIENNKKLKEENKRLKSIINGLDNTIENLEEIIKGYEHKQYITDLITENGIICQKNKEIERLNNIINELEKDMNRDDLSYVETQYVLNKIKELKGEDKECII